MWQHVVLHHTLPLAIGLLLSFQANGGFVVAQTIWNNAQVIPWATSLKCPGTPNLVATVSNQPVLCLYASGNSDGNQILAGACTNQNVQWFTITKDSAGLFTFKNALNGKCVDGWGQGIGGQLKQYDCVTGTLANQKFSLEYTRAVTGCASDWSSYRIKSGSRCVTISGSQLLWQNCASDKFTANQNFFIKGGSKGPAPSPPPTIPSSCKSSGTLYCGSQSYAQYKCSPPVTSATQAILTVNDFSPGGDGGGASECDGQYHSNSELIVALSTGWYNGGARCFNKAQRYIAITSPKTGKTVNAKVVDECDSVNGCDAEHAYQPPCRNNIVDGSAAVWAALGYKTSDPEYGQTAVTWRDV